MKAVIPAIITGIALNGWCNSYYYTNKEKRYNACATIIDAQSEEEYLQKMETCAKDDTAEMIVLRYMVGDY